MAAFDQAFLRFVFFAVVARTLFAGGFFFVVFLTLETSATLALSASMKFSPVGASCASIRFLPALP